MVLPAGVLIFQQWTLSDRLAGLEVHERYARVRRAVDSFMQEVLETYHAQNLKISDELLAGTDVDTVLRGEVPPTFQKLAKVRASMGRPPVLFTAVPIEDSWALAYYALDEESIVTSFRHWRVEPVHTAALVYLHSSAGTDAYRKRLRSERLLACSEESPEPIGSVHLFHLPLCRDNPIVPEAYVGFWEPVEFAIESFLKPLLDGEALRRHLQDEELDPDLFHYELSCETDNAIRAASATKPIKTIVEARLAAYGDLFAPLTFRLGTVAGEGIRPGLAIRRKTWWLLGLAAILLTLGAILLVRSGRRDQAVARSHTDFVARVSHELKTPVAVLLNAVQSIENPKLSDPEDLTRCSNIIRERVKELAKLLERLMEVCRIDADQLPVATTPVNILEYIERTLPRLCETATLNPDLVKIKLVASATTESRQLGQPFKQDDKQTPGLITMADEAALDLILRNLLDNVAKHAGPDTPITVACILSRRWVAIQVQDQGPGINAKDLRRVFRKFYRAQDSLQAARPGHGLGLALVKALVGAHGGKATAESQPGQGATFTIRFPRERSS